MRGRLLFLLFAAIVVMSASTAVANANGATTASGATRGYIVVLKNTVADPGAVAAVQGRAHGFRARFVYRHALKGYAASIPAAAVAAISSDPRVSFVSPDTPVAAATSCSPTEQCLPIWADRIDAEQSSTISGNGSGSVNINVAVVDSGIDLTHPDLNVVGGVNCSNGKSYADVFGHGTRVAGIIGARDNTFGIVGVAPGARLWSVRVINDQGAGSTSSFLCGIDWVTGTRTDTDPTNDIAVANMSLVGKGRDDGNCGKTPRKDAVHIAICASTAAGVTSVVAAGNDAADFQKTIPAAYDEVLTATAMGDTDGQPGGTGPSSCLVGQADDTPAFFSDFATLPSDQAHTIAASGVCIASTALGGSGYGGGSGTSFATPAVAGTVALCIASGPCAGLTPAQIIQKIVADAAAYNTANPGYGFTGDPLHNPDPNKYYGYLIHAGSY
jgi:subtilisin family serine protease